MVVNIEKEVQTGTNKYIQRGKEDIQSPKTNLMFKTAWEHQHVSGKKTREARKHSYKAHGIFSKWLEKGIAGQIRVS